MLLVGTIVVGRDPRCDISDANPLLSRRHAEFDVTPQGVRLRDLESRNGILVNGAKATESMLKPGDVVVVGHLTIKYLDDGLPPGTVAPKPHNDDATVMVGRSATGAPQVAAPVKPPPPQDDDESDKTRMVAPPVRQASAPAPVPAAPPAPVQPRPRPQEDEPASRTLAKALPPRVESAPRPAVAKAPTSETAGSRQLRTAVEPRLRKGRMAKASWGGRVLISVLGLSAVVFVVTAIPMQMFQGRVVDSIATARATALANWLAADAASRLSAGESLATAADAVAHEPGVVTAVILSPEGQVLSPASRATKKIETLPGIAEPPSNIFRLLSSAHDGLIEVARPFGTAQRPRAGTAWVTFRSAVPTEAGSVFIILGPALFVALAGGLIVANLISRMADRALVALNEDIELAVTGLGGEVRDTLGTKPLADLANTVNYLVARLKSTADARTTGSRGSASPAGGPFETSMDAGPSKASRTARLEADSKFRIASASPECADLIGVRPDALVGVHLIDAIPDKQIVDAVFKLVGLLGTSREETMVVAPEGRSYQLEVTVSQKGKDQPIFIGLRVQELARA